MGHEYRSAGPDRSRAVLIRDAALARVSRARRWVIAGAAALTAGLAALMSAVAPGRSLAPKTPTGAANASASSATSSGGSAIPRMPALASPSDLGLQSPGQGPSPDQSQPQDSQPQSQPQDTQPQPAPAPVPAAPPSGGVVSGGS